MQAGLGGERLGFNARRRSLQIRWFVRFNFPILMIDHLELNCWDVVNAISRYADGLLLCSRGFEPDDAAEHCMKMTRQAVV